MIRADRMLDKPRACGDQQRSVSMAETGKQSFPPGIKDKVVVITGASSGKGEAT
jgi:hypothetical protein